MASRYHWFTPYWGFAGGINLPTTNALTIGLLSPESDITDRLQETSYRVTRIVGQWQIRWDNILIEAASGNNDLIYFTNRVYPVSSDGTNVFTRDLQNIVDADTDWMWNHVDAVTTSEGIASGKATLGSWGELGPGSTGNGVSKVPFQHGRKGHVDIKVDRRIEEGEELIWKLQVNNYRLNAASIWQEQSWNAGNVTMGLWIRMLVKEGY